VEILDGNERPLPKGYFSEVLGSFCRPEIVANDEDPLLE